MLFRSALIQACIQHDYKIEEMLLKYGANPNLVDDDGNSPLYYLCSGSSDPELIPLMKPMALALLKRGARVNAKNEWGATPLIEAASYLPAEDIKLLIKHGANVNSQDNEGRTALMYASHRLATDVMKVLLDAGANRHLRDHQSRIALDYTRLQQFDGSRFIRLSGQPDEEAVQMLR